jgi:Uma2 family endonuclease
VEDLHAREDEGRGLELEDGWLVRLSPSPLHNFAYRRLHEFIEAAARLAGASVYVDRGGDWEIRTPAGIRKPDVFAVPSSVAEAWFVEGGPTTISGHELLLIAEVVSPGSGSETTDRVRKLKEYAALNVPQYWIVDYTPKPVVQVFVLDEEKTDPLGGTVGVYRLEQTAKAGEMLEVEVEADKPFTVRFDPGALTEF